MQMEKVKDLGVHSKRRPSYVLMNPHIQAHQESADHKAALNARSNSDRDRMRPDVMVIECQKQKEDNTCLTQQTQGIILSMARRTNLLAEAIAVTQDTLKSFTEGVAALCQGKMLQLLESALRSYGYDATVLTYILRFYGSMYTSELKTLHALGQNMLQQMN